MEWPEVALSRWADGTKKQKFPSLHYLMPIKQLISHFHLMARQTVQCRSICSVIKCAVLAQIQEHNSIKIIWSQTGKIQSHVPPLSDTSILCPHYNAFVPQLTPSPCFILHTSVSVDLPARSSYFKVKAMIKAICQNYSVQQIIDMEIFAFPNESNEDDAFFFFFKSRAWH